jgi:hypothetical protein
MCGHSLNAQEPRVSLGAVTKLAAQVESEQARETLEFLSMTEAHAAAAFIKATDIEYMDRGSMDSLLADLRLSSSSAFDTSTGPAPGLLGRLDFLVVVEAALPTSVRLRTIDLESGAVKAMSICEAEAGWFGGSSVDYSECLSPFVTQTLSVARQRLATKKLEAEQEAAATRAREEERLESERRRQEAEERAEQQRQEGRRQRAARQREINQIRPEYEEIMFWDEMTQMLAESGNTFRPEIAETLATARSKRRECTNHFNDLRSSELRSCVVELNREVDALESFR